MSNILIFGSTGFIGKSLVEKISKKEKNVKIMIHTKKNKIKCKKFQGDILRTKSFENQIKDKDIIINTIGQYDNSTINFIEINIKGGINLLESCRKKENVRIILISSLNVYGENAQKPCKETDNLKPQKMYGKIKLLTEQLYKIYSETYELDITILRLGNVYGNGKKNGIISNLINSIKSKKLVTITHNGNQIRDYVHIDDAIEGILLAVKYPKKGFNIFNISSGKKNTTNEIIKIIEKKFEKKLFVKINNKKPDEKCIISNISKAKKSLKFKPKIGIEKGIAMLRNKQ
jgi:UDP-glucose 4-epimerase